MPLSISSAGTCSALQEDPLSSTSSCSDTLSPSNVSSSTRERRSTSSDSYLSDSSLENFCGYPRNLRYAGITETPTESICIQEADKRSDYPPEDEEPFFDFCSEPSSLYTFSPESDHNNESANSSHSREECAPAPITFVPISGVLFSPQKPETNRRGHSAPPRIRL